MWRLLARNRNGGEIVAVTVRQPGYEVKIYGRRLDEP